MGGVAVPGNPALLRLLNARRVLLLQGPVGPFFDRLAVWLQEGGTAVQRVAFHPGDVADCQALRPLTFRHPPALWRSYLDGLITADRIDTIVLFGQSRRHHAAAIELARLRGVVTVVMEEGYVRPGYATLELGGVNGLSTTLDRYHRAAAQQGLPSQTPAPTRHPFGDMALQASRHYWHLYWQPPLHPGYLHHRSTSIWEHGAHWAGSWLRKLARHVPDRCHTDALREQRYFLVPLQHDGDAQITHHSHYDRTTQFVEEVMRSFARHAGPADQLVIRQHPHARGSHLHEPLIRQLTRSLRLGKRVHFLIEGHTPTLLTHATGVVVINSTVGLQAIMRAKPLMVMGQTLYRRPELCFQGSLDDFWSGFTQPHPAVCKAFVRELIALTQVPCNLYGPRDEPLLWSIDTTP